MRTRLVQKGSILLTCALLWVPESSALTIRPGSHADALDGNNSIRNPTANSPLPETTNTFTPVPLAQKHQEPPLNHGGQFPMPSGSSGSALDLFSPISVPTTYTNDLVAFMSMLPSPTSYSNTGSLALTTDVVLNVPELNASEMDSINASSYFDDILFNKLPDTGTKNMARTSVVPEPATALILCLGALGMGIRTRWHQVYP